MNLQFEHWGLLILRASWQGVVLAVAVALIIRLFGEWISPRRRFVLWSVVLVRMSLIVVPASPFSLFNAAYWIPSLNYRETARHDVHTESATKAIDEPETLEDVKHIVLERPAPPNAKTVDPTSVAINSEPDELSRMSNEALDIPPKEVYVQRRSAWQLALVFWIVGYLVFVIRLVMTALIVRRRYAMCRPVTDATVLTLLDESCQHAGVRRIPPLLVTPDAISPCLIGLFCPKIILPESILTDTSRTALRHVLAHEIAHLVRGDLFTIWLMIWAKALHWFNPVTWWVVEQMQVDREAACDELAVTSLGESNRNSYAATIIDLASGLSDSRLELGMIGLFSSTQRLTSRILRLSKGPRPNQFKSRRVIGLIMVLAMIGLTDSMPASPTDQPAKETVVTDKHVEKSGGVEEQSTNGTYRGRCIDWIDKSPMSGARIRLFKVTGWTAPIVEIAKSVCDENGGFEFKDLELPRSENVADRLIYLLYADIEGRPFGLGGTWTLNQSDPFFTEIHMMRESRTVSGVVIDTHQKPVVGASVSTAFAMEGRSTPGVLSAISDAEGRFRIDRIPDFGRLNDSITVTVSHPDFPVYEHQIVGSPDSVTVVLEEGCLVTGTVIDAVANKPAPRAVVIAMDSETRSTTPATTNVAGQFRMILKEGSYSLLAHRKDRVCPALTNQDFAVGDKIDLPTFRLLAGGFISGRVINTKTGERQTKTDDGRPIALGLYGPAAPSGKVISPTAVATVDTNGKFVIRAAPGENFPYFVNTRGDRMAWDTTKQPPVMVEEGKTIEFDMTITPEVSPADRLKAARELVNSLPKPMEARATKILDEIRKCDFDNTECWCTLMRELVNLGPEVVPRLCQELDKTTENRMLRHLAFAFRAIKDPRAVPALIRAIPRTLLPSSSDCGLLVADPELLRFMQTNDLDLAQGGTWFTSGRPEREVLRTLEKLTRHNVPDGELGGISMSSNLRCQALQRRMFVRHAKKWQTWWELHWNEFTKEKAYRLVNLSSVDEELPPVNTINPQSRFEGVLQGDTLSPAGEAGSHFLDIDTGLHFKWPADIPIEESFANEKRMTVWAAEKGIDLMCKIHRADDGTETYVLRTLGVQVRELNARERRNLDRSIGAGTIPQGTKTGELLMHFNPDAKQFEPDSNASFLAVTSDGNTFLIETTDRVNQLQNLNGQFGGPPKGVGFHKGVRFNFSVLSP